MTKEKEILQCPFGCKPDTMTLAQHIFYYHDEEDVANKLAELLSKQQESEIPIPEFLKPIDMDDVRKWVKKYVEHFYVPVSKIEARIAEINEKGLPWNKFQCGMNHDAEFIKELKDLLVSKEKEKPE
jgi:hypothetical protein